METQTSGPITKRLYIGGISESVSENEIVDRFSRFGKVSDVRLKSRLDEEGNCLKVFAHMNIEGNEDSIRKCFNTYQNTKWKGSVLKIQYAKENFLTRLDKERKEAKNNLSENSSPKKSETMWREPDIPKLEGPAVPGTPIPGKKDWVVGKYGRVLPVLNVRKSYKFKALKHDPSKFCHSTRVFKEEKNVETSSLVPCDNLTWSINHSDSELTKKRKGEFPHSPSKKKHKHKSVKSINSTSSDMSTFISPPITLQKPLHDDFEIVGIGHKRKITNKESSVSRFDSDFEDESQTDIVGGTNSNKSNSKNRICNDTTSPHHTAPSDVSQSTNPVTSNPKNDRSENSHRKVPEFGGLGMLMASSCKSLLDDLESVKDNSLTDNVGKEVVKKELNSDINDILLIQNSVNEDTDSSHQISVKETSGASETCSVKQTTSKKLLKKEKESSKSSTRVKNKKTKTADAVALVKPFKKSTADSEDDSVSSADTDEIIATCKRKSYSENLSINQNKGNNSKSILNKSMDFSEFSASAPEIQCNSFDNSSNFLASNTSDSYDSDLDSNDFKLVAKKLAEKADKSKSISYKKATTTSTTTSSSTSKTQPNTSASETLSTAAEIKLSQKSLDDIISEKLSELRGKLTNPSQLQGKLKEIAESNLEEKHRADNKKRLQALQEQKKKKDLQKHIVKTALENVDAPCTKRIVFDSSDDDDNDNIDESTHRNSSNSIGKESPSKDGKVIKEAKNSSATLKLLDTSSSDESDVEEMFRSRPHFEGKKGEKLMEMQRKIGDSRFQMDEKFMDSDDSDDEGPDKNKEEGDEDSFANEKKMNLEVLENVVGKSKIDQFTAKIKKNTKHIVDMNAIRFDPTKAKAQQAENETKAEMKIEAQPQPKQEEKIVDKKNETLEEKMKKNQSSGKSSVTMSSSLVDLYKNKAKEEEEDHKKLEANAIDNSFSLLQQFNEMNDDKDIKVKENNAGKGVLSALFKADDEKIPCEEESDSEMDEESSHDELLSNAMSDEENSDDEQLSYTKADENSKDESPPNSVVEKDSSSDCSEESHPEEELKKKDTKETVLEESPFIDEADSESSHHPEGEDMDDDKELSSITAFHDPLDERKKILLNAGRMDIRFTKEDWLSHWDEIRSDLMKTCARKHKDSRKKKRIFDEKKRKKDIFKNIKRRPWTRLRT